MSARHQRALEAARREALELLQPPARRRALVRRLRRAADLPAVPEDGARAHAGAVERGVEDPGRLRLAVAAREGRPGARGPLHGPAQRARQAARAAWPDLPQVPEPDPGPGEAQAPDRRPDRRARPGSASTPTSRATRTRGCWRRTRPTSRRAPASTSRRAP